MDFVFLHGGGQGGWIWDETIAAMKIQTGGEFGRALALDAPGCGAKRGQNTKHIDTTDIAEELIGDIERANFADVVMVGHSQAGTEIPLMLKLRPNLFQRVIHLASAAPAPGKTLMTFNEELYPPRPKPQAHEEIFALMRHLLCNDMPDEAAAAFMAKMGKDSWPPLTYAKTDWIYDDEPSKHPTTYIQTLEDTGLPIPIQEIFAKRLKADRTVRIDAGHQAHNSRPHAVAEIVLQEARRAIP